MPSVSRAASPVPPWLAPVACALAGLAWGAYLVGPASFLPSSLDWMLQEDWAVMLLGWLYGRDAPWSLPLGAVPDLLYPVGTSLAYTDATPWWSLLFKVLSPLLPRAFQIHGPWLALCFTLQGLFGALLVARLTRQPLLQWLGGLLFVMSPVLAARLGHLSLCAHWLLLASLWLFLRPCPDARTAWRTVGLAGLFIAVGAGLNLYLTIMELVVAFALLVRLWRVERRLPGLGAALGALGLLGLALGVLALWGYFHGVTSSAPGFNDYSANLLTFVNADGLSRVVPGIDVGPGQYEGTGYLGLGVLGLGLAVGAALVRERPPRLSPGLRPLVVACGLLALFSLSARIRWGPWTVLSVVRATEPVLAPLAHAFRAPGRFIWPLHYLLILGVIAGLLWVLRERPARAAIALALAVGLQAAELPAEACCRSRFASHVAPTPGGEDTWTLAAGTYAHLALFPARREDGAGRGCGRMFAPEALPLYAGLAWRHGMTFNSGYVSRLDEARTLEACAREEADVVAGRVAPDTVYVVHPLAAAFFRERTADQSLCGSLDGVLVCVSRASHGPFREALERSPPPRR